MARRSRRLEEQIGHSAAQSGFMTDTNTYEDIGSSISHENILGKVRFDREESKKMESSVTSNSTVTEMYSSYNASTAEDILARMDPLEAMDDDTVCTDLTISIDCLTVESTSPQTGWYCVEGNIITTSKLQSLRRRKGMSANKSPVASFRTGMSQFIGQRCEWKSPSGRRNQRFRISKVRLPGGKYHESQLNRRYLELIILRGESQNSSPAECVPIMKDKALADLIYKPTPGNIKKRRRAQMTLSRDDVPYQYAIQVYVTMLLSEDSNVHHVHHTSPLVNRSLSPNSTGIMPEHTYSESYYDHAVPHESISKQETSLSISWLIVGRNLLIGVTGGILVGSIVGGICGGLMAKSTVIHATHVKATTASVVKTATAKTTATTSAVSSSKGTATASAASTAPSTAPAASTTATHGTTAPSTAHAGYNAPLHESESPTYVGACLGALTGLFSSLVCSVTSTPSYCDPYVEPQPTVTHIYEQQDESNIDYPSNGRY